MRTHKQTDRQNLETFKYDHVCKIYHSKFNVTFKTFKLSNDFRQFCPHFSCTQYTIGKYRTKTWTRSKNQLLSLNVTSLRACRKDQSLLCLQAWQNIVESLNYCLWKMPVRLLSGHCTDLYWPQSVSYLLLKCLFLYRPQRHPIV